MRKKVIISVAGVCVVLLLFLYLNSYSIVLWRNGFCNKDVYQQVGLNNENGLTYFTLAANENRFGILYMKKNAVGIWYGETMTPIVDKNSTSSVVAMADSSRFSVPLSDTDSCYDSFLAGLVDKDEFEKIYSIPQQSGCLFSADLYQLTADQYLVFFHVTANETNALNKTNGVIQDSVQFEKMQ